MGQSLMNDEVALFLDNPLVSDKKLIHKARRVWVKLDYGRPRAFAGRITKGVKKAGL